MLNKCANVCYVKGGQKAMTITTWNIENITGYKPITTFYEDFSIADRFGINAVKDTYKRAFKGWKENYKYITELCMVLNWKSWEHNSRNNKALVSLYVDLFYELQDWCYENLEGEELNYFIQITD